MAVSFPSAATFPGSATFPGTTSFPASTSFPVPVTPFDPSTIPGLQVFLWEIAANCASNTPGNPVTLVSPSFGTHPDWHQGTPILRPLFRTDGLEFDTTTQYMDLLTQQVLTDFTMYCVGTRVSGSAWIPVASVTQGSFVGSDGGTINLLDDVGDGPFVISNPTGLILLRGSATGGVGSLNFTGNGAAVSAPIGTITIDCLGASPANAAFNGNTGNRHLLQIISNQNIVPGSAMDTNILTWIQQNTGAIL